MIDSFLPQTLLLLGAAVAVVVAFHRLRIPSSLGYLLVGVMLGEHTPGPVIDAQPIRALAEFGIVFLLFTVGLNFSMPQIHALRHQVLGLGTAQVVLSTLAVGALAWLAGLPPAAAFVVGAVFAQSSTTIISKQLAEQGEEHSRHGRLGLAMSVFQDVTAVPFVVVIPVLATLDAGSFGTLAGALGSASAKAVLAFALVFLAGRWILRPTFYLVAEQRSAEVFTLTVLFVSLMAAWTTSSLGLSMAFGAFLAGMMLGETEFRHQVEATIRPFRDVLLGLFFIGVGMMFNPYAIPDIWQWALLATVVLLVGKAVIVAQIVRRAGIDALSAWRTGWLLAVGGEFGFALLAIALDARVIDEQPAQIALTAVLFSMVAAPFLIRYSDPLARLCAPRVAAPADYALPSTGVEAIGPLKDHVIVCGYGRIGQSVANFLAEEDIPYVALDLDPARVKTAHMAGEPVFYGDAADRGVLEAAGVDTARLMVISHEDTAAAIKILTHLRRLQPKLPVMVRTRDETHVDALRAAGATEVVPETLEASLMIAAHTLVLLDVPMSRVVRRMRDQRKDRYQLLREFFRGEADPGDPGGMRSRDRLRPVVLPPGSPAVGRALKDFSAGGIEVTALVRQGHRQLMPAADTVLQAGDVVVLFGAPDELERAEQALCG